MRITSMSLVFALSLVGSLHTASACVCVNQVLNDRDDAAAQFNAAAVVFEGEVLERPQQVVAPSHDTFGLSVIVFQVLRPYKGNLGDSVQLYDAAADSDCGFDDVGPGEKFFVYGFEGKDYKIYIQACTRTRRLNFAGPDIRFARKESAAEEDLVPPGEKLRLHRDPTLETRGASIAGTVRSPDGSDVSETFVHVWDTGEDGHRSRAGAIEAVQKVNADGSFTIRFLAPGRYNVTALDSRQGGIARYVGESGKVTLSERQLLPHLIIPLHGENLGKVSVQVIAERNLGNKIIVRLQDAGPGSIEKDPYGYGTSAFLNEKGVAVFDHVPHGLYKLSVELNGVASLDQLSILDDVLVRLDGSQSHTVIDVRHRDSK